MRSLRICSLSLLVLAASLLRGQTNTGEITGTVQDDSGAAIPSAIISVVNTETGLERSFETDVSGNFTITQLLPGKYLLRAEKAGFQRFVREGLVLQVGQRARVDLALRVGSVAESLEVSEQAPLLEVEDAALGQVIENRKILELPMNGRNVVGLAALTTGVTPGVSFGTGIPDGRAALVQAAAANLLINGGLGAHNDVLMDGVPLGLCCQNQVAMIPTIDITQEFRVQTSVYDAQLGRTSGGLVSFASKGGTNEFHGSAYEFLRNRSLDANNFFNNRAGVAKAHFVYNQFGASVGGPVLRNKLFFFFNYEGIRNRKGSFMSGTVPTGAERAGIFSVPVYDPLSTQAGSFTRTPFPGNQIPTNRFDPVAVSLMKLWPFPNVAGPINFLSNASAGDNQNQYHARVDYHFGPRHQLFERFSMSNTNGTMPNYFNNIASPSPWAQFTNNRNAVLDDTFTLSATTVLNLRYGYTRQTDRRKLYSDGVDLTTFGWPASYSNARPVPVLPKVAVSGLISLSGTASFANAPDVHVIAANLSKSRGAHFMKLGFDGRDYRANASNNSDGAGSFSFNTAFTRGPDAQRGTNGSAIASMLLGFPASGDITDVQPYSTIELYTGLYFQDDIHVSRKLTINLGLRWEVEAPRHERHNRLSYFDPLVPSPVAAATGIPGLRGGLKFPGVSGNPRGQQDTDWNNLGPRFGFAWHAKSHLVLRGGYGITYIPIFTRYYPASQQGFSATTNFFSSVDGITPVGVLRNPFPSGITPALGGAGGPLSSYGQSFSTVLRNAPVGYNQEFSFNVQYEVAKDLLVDAAYVGNRGVKLPISLAIDTLNDNYLSLGTALLASVTNPFQPYVSTGALSAATTTRRQLLLPFPQFLGVTANAQSVGDSTYHAFQLKVNKRFGNGFSLLGAYTNSKLLTDTGGLVTSFLEVNSPIQNPNNLRLERSVAPQDISQRLVISYVWELPVGRGKKYWSTAPRVLDLTLGGWQINGITTFQRGQPITVGNAIATTSGATRPNNIGRSARKSGSVQGRLNQFFDRSVFTAPGPFEDGNTARTLPDVRGDGNRNFDLSIFKSFAVKEKKQVQFRAEFFNIFNTVQFAPPGSSGTGSSSFGNADFGVISVQRNDPRNVQLALKFLF
jgi:hypothetical protein